MESSHLRLLGRFLQTLQRHAVLGKINALVLAKFVHNPVHDALVDVVAAQVRVAVGGLDLHHAFADFQNRNVERAAAKVVHGDRLVLLLVESVGERRRGRLVDDAQHFQPRDLARVLRRLALRVVEVGGDGDHRLRDLLAQVLLGRVLHLLQDHGGDFRWRILLAHRCDARIAVRPGRDFVGDGPHLAPHFVLAPSHEPFDRVDRVLGVGDRLAFRNLTHQTLPGLGERHHRRRRPPSLGIGDDGRLTTLHYRHDRIGRSQVDANDLAHPRFPPCRSVLLAPLLFPLPIYSMLKISATV